MGQDVGPDPGFSCGSFSLAGPKVKVLRGFQVESPVHCIHHRIWQQVLLQKRKPQTLTPGSSPPTPAQAQALTPEPTSSLLNEKQGSRQLQCKVPCW